MHKIKDKNEIKILNLTNSEENSLLKCTSLSCFNGNVTFNKLYFETILFLIHLGLKYISK